MNPHIVELGVFAHVNEGLLKVLGVAVDPLALVAKLGDGVSCSGRKSRGSRT